MKAEIVSVGTEILLGHTLDTNSGTIAKTLPQIGIDLYFTSQVDDNLGRIVNTIRQAWQRSDLIVVTGGLGPTEDDLTREAIATALGENSYVDPDLEQDLLTFMNRHGISFSENNMKQAMLIPSARPIANPRGTAPGWWVERDGRIIVAMPGVPAEMDLMWTQQVTPQLAMLGDASVLFIRVLKITGLSEARVDEVISPIVKHSEPRVSIYAKPDGVHLYLAAKGADRSEARRQIEPVEKGLRRILGDRIWGTDDDTLERTIGRIMDRRGLSLASMESCTGGLFASTVTDTAGSSSYFRVGHVAYTLDAKRSLGVRPELIRKYGAVSKEVAIDMARATREREETDIGVGITGVAGPEPLEGKEPGIVHIGICAGESVRSKTCSHYQDRATTKARTVTAAMALLLDVLRLPTG